MEEKEKIIQFADSKFAKFGFFKTTMDEIAKEMKISKKTIYKHFSSKNMLVRAVMDTIRFTTLKQIEKIINSDENAILKLYQINIFLAKRMSKISDTWLNDIRFHAPELWEELEEFRRKSILANLSRIVEQGKKEGLIEDKPTILILTIIISSVQAVVNPEFTINNNFSLKQALNQTLETIFMGIATKKGRKLLKQYNPEM